jgi:hypothetical protein
LNFTFPTPANGSPGCTDIYVRRGALDDVAAKLEGFPRNTFDEREAELRDFDSWAHGGAVRMRFFCTGGAGHAFVEIWIESMPNGSGDANTVHFCSRVEAHSIDLFVAELRRLEGRQAEVAQLRTV